MRIDKRFWDIAAKQLNGRATPAEQEELNRWLEADPVHQEQYQAQARLWQLTAPAPIPEVDTDAAWQKVHAKVQQQEAKVIPLFQTALRVAASVILVLGLAWLMKYYFFPFYGMEVIESGNRQITVVLPDSTHVWLNKGSRLVYDANFSNPTRDVQLEGEAFFEVYRDVQRPFIIQTDQALTTVLGTSFNLRAYLDAEREELAVATGKVAFVSDRSAAEAIVTPGYTAILNKQSDVISKHSIKDDNAWAWKSGKLQFDGKPLRDVLPDLERYYGVKFQLQNTNMTDCRFTGSFEHAELGEVLQVLEATLQLEHKQQDEHTFIITGQGCR